MSRGLPFVEGPRKARPLHGMTGLGDGIESLGIEAQDEDNLTTYHLFLEMQLESCKLPRLRVAENDHCEG